jgi:hypothetical protein
VVVIVVIEHTCENNFSEKQTNLRGHSLESCKELTSNDDV